jgi:hypothetical protein
MKKFIFYPVLLVFIASCSDNSKTASATSTDTKSADMKAAYEKNLASIKSGIAAIEKEDIEGWASNVADNVVFSSPMYGDTVTTKQHWKDILSGFFADWDSLKLVSSNFLPGVDSASHEPDGSVRYYGTWTGVHKSGKHTSFKFYGAFDFNKDAKIMNADEYFDVSGVLSSVKSK